MGTKKGQRRKTARRAYTDEQFQRESSFQDFLKYKKYTDKKERARTKAGASWLDPKFVPFDFKTWFRSFQRWRK